MNKLTGIKEINLFLNNWLAVNGFDCTVKFGCDFNYDYINEIITYAFVLPEFDTETFIKYCERYIPNIAENDPFIISFFHELGHYMTEGEFTEEEWDSYNILCDILDNKDDISQEEMNLYYSNIIEDSATKWACDFISDNQKLIERWWNELQPLVINFIELNNIEDA